MIRVHHLNCISTCPMGGKLMDGRIESIVQRGHLACHCLLVETDSQLILVDTGLGLGDVRNPRSRLSGFFLGLVSPDFREEMTAVRQIEQLGFDPRDVRHILMTHLDFDHAGGLDEFPEATVHLLQLERDSAFARKTWLDRQRFRPQQWGTRDHWKVYHPTQGESWYGFKKVRGLEGVPPEILMVPLRGHTYGHSGIAIRRESDWLFLAGDAYFYFEELDPDLPRCTPGLRFYQTMMEKDRRSRLANQRRLRELQRNHAGEITIFCSHDLTEFERLSGRSAEVPAGKMAAPARVERLKGA